MKTPPRTSSLKVRFDHASAAIESRFGDKPIWVKLVVFVPVLIVLTAIVALIAHGLGTGLLMIAQLLQHS
jgi:hypothetical protein